MEFLHDSEKFYVTEHARQQNFSVGLFTKLQAVTLGAVLRLAYQSLGVVYGDLGTSPLYVYKSTFVKGVDTREDIVGALSVILYTLTIIPLIKYIFIVLRANDNGEGI